MEQAKRIHCCFLTILLAGIPATLAATQRTVVLANGNVVRGDVEQLATQVVVRTRTAELRFALSDVELISRDLQSAYERKAASISSARPVHREKLVLWCLKAGLHQQAVQELEKFRGMWPNHPRLDLLAQQVTSHRSEVKATILPSSVALHIDTQFGKDHLDLLSKSTIGDFVRRVQPLMMNRCGQAGCHGKATTTSFALVGRPRSSIPTALTHRNLGSTLQRLNGPAAHSLLWMSASHPHGELKKNPMSPSELRTLYKWIERACDELGAASHPGVMQATAEVPLDEGVDPFDPAEFNRATAIPEPVEQQ